VKPTEVSKEILSFENKTKDIVTVAVVILYFISSQMLAYSLMPELYLLWISALSIIKALAMSFVGFYAFNLGIQLFGKVIGGKGSFRDVGVVTAYSTFTYVVLSLLISIVSKLLWLGLLWSVGIFIPMIWFLIVYSKSLSQAQQFSESKVLVNVLVVGGIFYYLTTSVLPWLGL
jgi:Yip1 domain